MIEQRPAIPESHFLSGVIADVHLPGTEAPGAFSLDEDLESTDCNNCATKTDIPTQTCNTCLDEDDQGEDENGN